MKNKPHYYYRFAEESNTGKQLQAFFAACADAQEQARAWAEKQGAKSYFESANGMAGGVVLVEFENCIAKEGWEKMTAPDGSVFFYPAPDSALEKEMSALPIVSEMKLIPILSLKAKKTKTGKPVPFTFGGETPILFLHHGFWYVDVPYVSEADGAEKIEERAFFVRKMAATNER